MTPPSATGTGLGYQNHVPLFAQLMVNSSTGTPIPGLIDTGAALSVIDVGLLRRLGGRPHGDGMPVQGLGSTNTLGWTTFSFFVDAKDRDGREATLEFQQDFHVLPKFAPGICLGLDFISHHDLSISSARGRVRVGSFTFAVNERLEGPYVVEAALCVTRETVVPPSAHVWVPIDGGFLAPTVDYTVFPRLSVTPDETGGLAGPACVLQHKARHHILLCNFGHVPIHLHRGTVVADASAARLGEVTRSSGQVFPLSKTDSFPSFPSSSSAYTVSADAELDAAAPLDAYLGDDESGSDLTREAATVLIDETWRVGVNAEGEPPEGIVALLRRHGPAFALDNRPGRIVDAEMEIPLRPDAPVRPEAPRRASPDKLKAMDAAIDQLIDWDVIEPSSSSVSFPVLMVRQHGKWRFCVDYRNLNSATVSDRYPLPTTDAIFQTLVGKRVFSALDAIRGYHQLPVKSSDRWKTAFAVVYIDDVVVASRDVEEHTRALDTLLSSATASGLKFSPSKCTFAVPSLVLLGRKVSGAGVAIWGERAKAVEDLARPKTLRELYHVLGLFGYYRGFIHRYAEVAAPLSRLTRGWRYEEANGRYRLVNVEGKPASADSTVIAWEDAQQESFDALKRAISRPPTLAHPDPTRPYVLYVDASKTAYAAILHQVFEETTELLPQTSSAPSVHTQSIARLPQGSARERWSAWLRSDRHFGPLLRRVEADGSEDWVLRDGVLCRRVDGKVALPEAALPELLRTVHDDGGHFGFFKTYLSLHRHFWRPQLANSVRAWVKFCSVCQRTKRAKKTGVLDVENDPQLPFEFISMDLLLGLPRSRSGNDAVLAILDVFSRMILLEPCSSSISAEGIAAVISSRVLRFGWKPRRIISDSEARMSGSVISQLAMSMGAHLAPSSPYHQQANNVERAIQTVQTVLQTMCLDSRAHWDTRVVPSVELAMNSAPSVTTGHRPFDLVFVSHPEVVHAVFDADEHLGVSAFSERLAAAEERLDDARRAIAAARREQKQRYDRLRSSPATLAPGDSVFVRLSDRPVPGAVRTKLDPRKMGPWKVAEVLSPHRVRLQLPVDANIDDEFNIEQLDRVPPPELDPFAADRVLLDEGRHGELLDDADAGANADAESLSPDHEETEDVQPMSRPMRSRVVPTHLRDFSIGALYERAVLDEALRGPIHRPRRLQFGDRSVLLVEHPVAYLSRLTSPTEQKLAAPELELSCLAWAFARWGHLLEGAQVTVVTDHSPMSAMLTSSSNVSYGPVITRCRAVLMPHLGNLRFSVKPGRLHANADALSRLPTNP
ncbi:hypothetical protein CF328_g7342 [Tilletia controversa]|nr:hypothetical protein CF328_g7342 [Tilletia controversa]